jgi:hypothetical protein
MAINKNFKVQNTLQAGASGLFLEAIKVGGGDSSWSSPAYDGTKVAIETYGKILSGGTDLSSMFGDAVETIQAHGSTQATIQYNTQNDTSTFSDVSVTGLGSTDAPTFGGMMLSGANTTTATLSTAATFTIDPVAIGDDTGTVIIKGDLQIDGTTTTINSTTLSVDDKNIVIAQGAASSSAADGAGITISNIGETLLYNYNSGNSHWSLSNNLVGGTGSNTYILASEGAQDLTLQTNGVAGTNSGNITITDGSNGDITIDPDGSGSPVLSATEVLQKSTGGSVVTDGVYHGTVTASTKLDIDTLAVADFTGADFLITIKSGANVGVIKLTAVNTGGVIDGTVYGEVLNGTISFGTIALTIASGKAQLSFGTAGDYATDGAKVTVKVTGVI